MKKETLNLLKYPFYKEIKNPYRLIQTFLVH